ncbi:MAG: beta-1,6-N-acetylglucosaminyltransferase [Methylovirgula sp.]|uniref:beta-1,6-N-acetylglucosaminyltransferase n=1 Tax=Methylovirgula sp. TaxID=1978224 RepID=UPI00307652C3
MIFYHIVCYHEFDNVKNLIKAIYRDSDFYYITVDSEDRDIIDDLARHFRGIVNVSISQLHRVVWAAFSQIAATANGMRFFIESTDCDWYVNLSEVCVPLKSSDRIEAIFKGFRDRGVHSMVSLKNSAGAVTFPLAPRVQLETLRQADGWQLVMQERGPCIVDCTNDWLVSNPKATSLTAMPLFGWGTRQGLGSAEIPSTRGLAIRPLNLEEALARRRFFGKVNLRGHRSWFTLGRDHVRALFASDIYFDAVNLFSSTLSPDESFFQTVLLHLLKGQEQEVAETNLRLWEGEPGAVGFDLVQKHFADDSSDLIFGRKMRVGDRDKIWQFVGEQNHDGFTSDASQLPRVKMRDQFFQISIDHLSGVRIWNAPTVETPGRTIKVTSLLNFPQGLSFSEPDNEIGFQLVAQTSTGEKLTRRVRIDAFAEKSPPDKDGDLVASLRGAYHLDLRHIFAGLAYEVVSLSIFATVKHCEMHWVGSISYPENDASISDAASNDEDSGLYTKLYDLMTECRPFTPPAQKVTKPPSISQANFDILKNTVQFALALRKFDGERPLIIESSRPGRSEPDLSLQRSVAWTPIISGEFNLPARFASWLGAGLLGLSARLGDGLSFPLTQSKISLSEIGPEVDPERAPPYLVLSYDELHRVDCVKSGFSGPDANFSWTIGPEVVIDIPVPPRTNGINLRLSIVGANLGETVPVQRMFFWLGAETLATVEIKDFDPRVVTVNVPTRFHSEASSITLRISLPEARSPASMISGNEDARPLGVRIRRISFMAA